MNVSFQLSRPTELPDLLFCWRLTIDVPERAMLAELFIPELFFDFFFLQSGGISCAGRPFPRQALKTLHTRSLDLVLEAPLDVYGARFSLPFAESYWRRQTPAGAILPQTWVREPVAGLGHFTSQVVEGIGARFTTTPAARMFGPALEETERMAAYSSRHKRRIYRSVFGIGAQELHSIERVHRFLGQACDFSTGTPRILHYVNDDAYFDQPHLNRGFKKVTGRSPLEYFEADSILQPNLMAASYNERRWGRE